jgi:hypothetical protein
MNLLYITFGPNERNHLQAAFSIRSFLSFNAPVGVITILTDQPGFYKRFGNRVNLIHLAPDVLKDWKGPKDFFWRVKIKSLQLVAEQFPQEPLMYLDTDTFLYRDFTPALELLARGKAGMHENEGLLQSIGTKSARMTAANAIVIRQEGFRELSSYAMWNAGAILTPNKRAGEEFRLALEICDKLLEVSSRPILVEQFALSAALEQVYGLEPLHPAIAHYWSTKEEWNELIGRYFLSVYLKDMNETEALDAFRQLDLHAIPIKRIQRNTKRRLKDLIDRMFEDKQISYLIKK